uniref:Si:dkey-182g1.6 n=1 Tax=Cyprinus carpio TaxID=7962 RepID=A0A8C1S3G3_CYPCA
MCLISLFATLVSLCSSGVFGATEVSVSVSVSVMKGDSVTLHTNVSELQSDDIIDWMRKDNLIIAEVKNNKYEIKNNTPTNGVPDRRFEGRLELDHKTGSLTIKNITSQHEGTYILDIRGRHLISKNFTVTVHDVVELVSVTEGDSVTLHTDVKIQKDDVIQWFGNQGTLIADLNSAADSRWSNIHLNYETGDLTIRNIRRDQSGVYKVEINNTTMILHRKFNIIVGAAKTVSVKEEELVTLHTGLTDIQRFDLILWKFEDHLIAEINKGTNQFIVCENAEVRFKGRLQVNEKTGSLTISGSETTDSGDYHLNMSNKMCTLHRIISVTVKGE